MSAYLILNTLLLYEFVLKTLLKKYDWKIPVHITCDIYENSIHCDTKNSSGSIKQWSQYYFIIDCI